jgi:hypothetical protein
MAMTGSAISLTDQDRRLLRAVFDRLIPPVDRLPGAGAMGVLDDVERIAAGHARYGRSLAQCLKALSRDASGEAAGSFLALDEEGQDAVVRGVEASDPLEFAVVLEAVYIAYYARPEVHKRIGWRTGPLQPAGFPLPPFDEAMLDIVRKRKPFWREAPD